MKHLTTILLIAVAFTFAQQVSGQGVQCDPTKVITAEACASCHANEVAVWKTTPHYRTFEELSRRPQAKQICRNMGVRSPKRSNLCISCHYTVKHKNGKDRPVSGISCESCHGAAKDWLTEHNNYGSPTATKSSESPAMRDQRLAKSAELGMRNTRNLYDIASSCHNCHTVPNEKLVNVGGHRAATEKFELVAYSQGLMRHNFLRGNNTTNVQSSRERLRVMYVVGLIADLEYSTRATALATQKSVYGLTVAGRAAKKAKQLYELQQQLDDPVLQKVLVAFAGAELKINNRSELTGIADQIRQAGTEFAVKDGSGLEVVDPLLPSQDNFVWQASR